MFPLQQQTLVWLLGQGVCSRLDDGKLHLDVAVVVVVAVVSIGLSIKYSDGDETDFANHQPMEGMRVELYDQQGNLWHL